MSETRPTEHQPGSHLPRAVREQVARADALMRGSPPADPPHAGGEQQQDGARDEPRQEEQPGQQNEQERRDAPPGPPQQEERQDGQPQKPDDYEHRLRSERGRWEAERNRLQGRMEGLERLIANLQAPSAPQPSNAPQETFRAPPDTELSEEDRRDYGDNLISVVRKVATQVAYEVAGRVRKEVREELGSQIGSVQTRVQKSAQEDFYGGLAQAVPDWEALNNDRGFVEWLAQPDPFSGASRQDLLNQAVNDLNPSRASAFFNAYKRETQVVSPQGSQPPAQSPAPQGPAGGRPSLESLAAPGRVKSGSGGSGPQANKPVYTRAQITKFYDDIRRGNYKGREADQAAMERDIFAAQGEGRVR